MRREVGGVVAGDAGAVHRMRVASRRLREALPVLDAVDEPGRPGTRSPRKVARTVRRVTRALGRVRELDVALALLDELERNHPRLRAATGTVRQVVGCEREIRRRAMARRVERADLGRMHREIRARAADAAMAAAAGSWKPALGVRIARRAAGVETAVEAAGGLYAPDRLHGVRIRAKKLRYVLELAHELGRVPALQAIRQLKQMQDVLGHMHDLEVLAGYTRLLELQASTRGRPHARIAGLLNTIEDEIRLLHAAYLEGRPVLDDVVALCRRDYCPRLGGGGTSAGPGS